MTATSFVVHAHFDEVPKQRYAKIWTFLRPVTSRERNKYNILQRNVSSFAFDEIITRRTLRIVLILKFDLISTSNIGDSWDLFKILLLFILFFAARQL